MVNFETVAVNFATSRKTVKFKKQTILSILIHIYVIYFVISYTTIKSSIEHTDGSSVLFTTGCK